jgi:transposase
LRTKGILKTFDACPFCGNFPPGKVRRQREKCSRYEREWSICRESLLEGLRIPLSKFVFALKLFAFEVPVDRAQRALGISYTTAHRVCGLLRKAICHGTSKDAHLVKGEVEADESSFGEKERKERKRSKGGRYWYLGY